MQCDRCQREPAYREIDRPIGTVSTWPFRIVASEGGTTRVATLRELLLEPGVRLGQAPAMTIRRIEPGPRMSQAVVHGGIAWLAGQVGAPGASVAEQTRAVLAQIDRLLAEAGSDKSRILTATIWLADIGTFAEMNSVWDTWVDPANPPARATGESKLATPEYKVEIIVTAACD